MQKKIVNGQIGKLRKEKGLTQKELADLLYVSPSTVSKWENGITTPDVYMLQELAKAFQVSVSDIMGEQKEEEAEKEELSLADEGAFLMPEKKSKRKYQKWAFAGSILTVVVVLLAVFLLSNKQPAFRAYVVDEYLDHSPEFFDYECIYQVALEYEGELTDEILTNYTKEHRQEYEKWFEEAEAIAFTFWSKYDNKADISKADGASIIYPTPEGE